MKTFLLITSLSGAVGTIASPEPFVSPIVPATPKPPTELTRLQKEFDVRRAGLRRC